MIKQYEDLFKLNEELAELVTDIFKTRDFKPKTYARTLIIFFVAKAYKTLRAILHLCSQGYGEDAGILLRSLFETAVNALYIKDNEELAQRYIGFEARRVYKLSQMPVLKDVYGRLTEDELGQIYEDYKKAQEKYKYTSNINWSGKSLEEMAKAVGYERLYNYVYRFLSQITHSTAGSVGHYVKPDPDRPVTKVKLSPSDNLIPEDMLTAGALMVDIARLWSNQFNLGMEAKIEEINTRLKELKEKNVQTGPQ